MSEGLGKTAGLGLGIRTGFGEGIDNDDGCMIILGLDLKGLKVGIDSLTKVGREGGGMGGVCRNVFTRERMRGGAGEHGLEMGVGGGAGCVWGSSFIGTTGETSLKGLNVGSALIIRGVEDMMLFLLT